MAKCLYLVLGENDTLITSAPDKPNEVELLVFNISGEKVKLQEGSTIAQLFIEQPVNTNLVE